MPRIPTYERQVRPGGGSRTALMPDVGAGSGLRAIAGGIRDASQDYGRLKLEADRKQEIEKAKQDEAERKRQETADRIEFAKDSSQFDLDRAGDLLSAQQSAQPGASGFTPAYLKTFDEASAKALEAASSPFARNLWEVHLAAAREANGRAALGIEAEEHARNQGQQIDDGLVLSQKIVAGNTDAFAQEYGKWGFTIKNAEIDSSAKRALLEHARKGLVNAAVMSWIDRNPKAALSVLSDPKVNEKEAPKSAGGFPVPIKLGVLAEQLNWKEYAEKRVAALRQDTSVALRQDIQNAEAGARYGIVPGGPVRTLADFQAAFDDPRVAANAHAQYDTARKAGAAVGSMNGMTSKELLGIIQSKPSASDPNLAVKLGGHAIATSAAGQVLQDRMNNPAGYAISTGDFGLKPLNLDDLPGFTAELKRRVAAVPGMFEKYGAVKLLDNAEDDGISRKLESVPSASKVDYLAAIRTSLSDDTVYRHFMDSISKSSPQMAFIGNLMATGAPSAQKNAERIARGTGLLSKEGGGPAFPIPSEARMRSDWVAAVGTGHMSAYRGHPETEEVAYQAFRSYYAAKASELGLNDPTAYPDKKTSAEAVLAATGGVMKWRPDRFGNETDPNNIVLPYGMPEGAFKSEVSRQWLVIRGGLGYSKTDVGDISLWNTGVDGEYVIISGASHLPDKKGDPVIIKVGNSTRPPGLYSGK